MGWCWYPSLNVYGMTPVVFFPLVLNHFSIEWPPWINVVVCYLSHSSLHVFNALHHRLGSHTKEKRLWTLSIIITQKTNDVGFHNYIIHRNMATMWRAHFIYVQTSYQCLVVIFIPSFSKTNNERLGFAWSAISVVNPKD